jgi:predicted GH43/DUF377 family glycosyl hydrolase
VLTATLTRIGTVMRADPDDPREAEGVLNPAAARVADGELYLFPRLVAAGNYSRIGRARVEREQGRPNGVCRLGMALEPTQPWERNTVTAGVEDPRITRIEALEIWVMAYVAYGPLGAKVALAVSSDLAEWHRLGPVQFGYEPTLDADFTLYPNKDAAFFPEPVRAPDGRPAFALLHRPFYQLGPGLPTILPAGITDERESIWISYIPVSDAICDLRALTRPAQHRLLAAPMYDWEAVKIGGGAAPFRIDEGWLFIYHGIRDLGGQLEYAAGAMLLDHEDVCDIRWRSAEPLLRPETGDELTGTVGHVVFPTAVDAGPDGFEVYYGMADDKIGVARLDLT